MELTKEKDCPETETSSIADNVKHIFTIILTVLVAHKKQNLKKILLN